MGLLCSSKRKSGNTNNHSMQSISIHPLTSRPTAAWKELSATQKVKILSSTSLKASALENHVRFVCMSDTHGQTLNLSFAIPDGDVFLHAGDFTSLGSKMEVQRFNRFLGSLPHKHKLVIAGNHEMTFDTSREKLIGSSFRNDLEPESTDIKDLITNATYLEDSAVKVEGIKVYGTPWQPEYRNWAFNLKRGQECLDKWNLIPDDVDILLSHSPPVGHGDLCRSQVRAGCVELLSTVQQRVKPLFHVFGHIHEGYGVTTDEEIVFINASTCTVHYEPKNLPIVFDFPIAKRKNTD